MILFKKIMTASVITVITLFSTVSIAEEKPEAIVNQLYEWVFTQNPDQNVTNLTNVKQLFDTKFYQNLSIQMKIKGDGEIIEHQFDYAPFTFAQDVVEGFKVDPKVIYQGNLALVTVKIINNKTESHKITVTLKQDNGNTWKIEDIASGTQSLSKSASEAALYIQKHHIKENSQGFYTW